LIRINCFPTMAGILKKNDPEEGNHEGIAMLLGPGQPE